MKSFCNVSTRFVVLGLVGVGFLSVARPSSPPQPALADRGHSAPARARVTGPDGQSRVLSFEGVGCAASMCSRVRIQSNLPGSPAIQDTWLDSVASITEITARDARFTFKDGTARRLPVVSGNRFLYLGRGRIEMGSLQSVEFLAR